MKTEMTWNKSSIRGEPKSLGRTVKTGFSNAIKAKIKIVFLAKKPQN
jgi:hypothetical protein